MKTFLLSRPRSPKNSKKVFSRSVSSDDCVQMLSSTHSNVQSLYLLLFFAVVVGIAFPTANAQLGGRRKGEAYGLVQFWLSYEIFSSNYFQIEQHIVLLHIQKYGQTFFR